MENKTYTMDFAGYPLSFNFGHYAEQADGSVLVRMGDRSELAGEGTLTDLYLKIYGPAGREAASDAEAGQV